MANPKRQRTVRGLGSLIAMALVVATAWVRPLSAQVAGGTIQGIITDKSGGVVSGAEISIKNVATNVITYVTTNDDGIYTVPNLLPGKYEISASAPKFSIAVASDVVLTVGAQQQVNLVLTPGEVSERVVVTGAAPLVDLSSSTLSNVVEATTVRELPLNGRDWTQLATLETGVGAIHAQIGLSTGPDRGNRGYGVQLTISGGRPQQNNYRLDGVSINDYSNGAPGSVLGSNLGVDAVEEFSVLTSNYSSEYGRTSGGVINAITRSGTNSFHGTAYEFLRNSALDAKNFFDPAIKPPFRRNQFGASAGGPIIKGRTFIFGDYEGDRQSTGISQVLSVPTQTARNGVSDPVLKKFLGFFPLDPAAPDSGVFNSVIKQVINENYFTIRGDHKLTGKDNLVGTYVYDKAVETQPDPLSVVLTGNSTKRQIVTAEDTHTFSPTILNTVRFGFSRVAAFAGQNVSSINSLANDTSLGIFTGQPNLPQRPAPGVMFNDGSVVNLPGGLGASPNYRFHWNSFQIYDDAFITKGIHFLKFGFATEYIQDNILASSDANGVVRFSSLTTFLNNMPAEADTALPGTITERLIRQHIYAGYIQDDIRLRPNLTVNAGIRYEIATVPIEAHGRISTLINPTTDAQSRPGNPIFANPTLHNFEPRLGFAWDPFKTGKTSVRGGFGIFDVLPLPYLYELLVPLAAPFYQLESGTAFMQGDFPGQISKSLGKVSALRQSFIEGHPERNYAMQWNLNIQREIVKGVSGMVAYVGSRAVHQAFRADDINISLPVTPLNQQSPIFQGINPDGSPIGPLMNPNVGQISAVAWNGDAHYHALQSKLTMRLGSRLEGQVSYTWGKAIDTGSSTVGGDTFLNSISSLPIFNPALRRGLADFNVTHNLVVSYNLFLPSPNGFAAPVNWILGGWQFGGVAEVSSGLPFTPIVGLDALGLGSTDPWDFPDRLTGPGCGSLVNPGNPDAYIKVSCLAVPSAPASFAALCLPNPSVFVGPGRIECSNRRGNLGRNALIGPPLRNVDFSVVKNNPVKRISETFSIQFRAEMFNIFNHPNFAPPLDHLSVIGAPNPSNQTLLAVSDISANNIRTNPGPGTIDTTVTYSRQIQFGLKFIW